MEEYNKRGWLFPYALSQSRYVWSWASTAVSSTFYDFDKFAKDQSVNIEKITIDNQHDSKILKEELVKQIYTFPEKQIIVVSDIGLTANYLIYIDNIEHGSNTEVSDEYEKYFNLTKGEMTNNIFNTYDHYLKNKYKININHKALEKVKNYIQWK